MIASAELLSDMEPRALQLAFEHFERTHTEPWLPPPAEIRATGERLHKEEIGRQFRESEEARAVARNRSLAERVAAGDDEYFGLADLAKVAREKFNVNVGDDKNNRETPKVESEEDLRKAAEVQAQKVAMFRASKAAEFKPCCQNGCSSGYVMRTQIENAKPVSRATPCECLIAWREKRKAMEASSDVQ